MALGAFHHLHGLTQSDGDRKGGWDCTDILQLELGQVGVEEQRLASIISLRTHKL